MPHGENPRDLKKVLEASPLAEKLPPDGKPSQEEGAGQEAANHLPGATDGVGREKEQPGALTFRPASETRGAAS